jgi:hypothetical protein
MMMMVVVVMMMMMMMMMMMTMMMMMRVRHIVPFRCPSARHTATILNKPNTRGGTYQTAHDKAEALELWLSPT